MSDNTSINGPVTIKENSRERVAFDLMMQIISQDTRYDNEANDRKYWLTLYRQCLKATAGVVNLESILKEE